MIKYNTIQKVPTWRSNISSRRFQCSQ